ncbi:MAG: PQQ-binding-like beta-propeller repeat protein [Candidatus Thermoplasmatota archaeon]|nr:PQQ-binding-like beta-propeller repeat protein [Candidatus Thermoplasmatota archaeon]
MGRNKLLNNLFLLTVLFITISSTFAFLTITSASSSLETMDEGDGFYLVDTFEEAENVLLTNCEISNGNIMLKTEGGEVGKTFDYYARSSSSKSKAYYNTIYSSLIFNTLFPPNLLTSFENEFNEEFDYPKIARLDGNTFPFAGQQQQDSRYKRIHHFRFYIDEETKKYASRIDIFWRGYAKNDSELSIYVWQPITQIINFGVWEKVASVQSGSKFINLTYSQILDLFISNDNYVDFCIVAEPESMKKCNLFTDYVNLTISRSGYPSEGEAISSVIRPTNIDSWELFTWEDNEKAETSVRYYLYKVNQTGYKSLVEETYLPSNKNGLTSGNPIVLEKIPKNYSLQIRAVLTTNNASNTPEISSWAITWQKDFYSWSDRFNSSLRLAEGSITNVDVRDGNVSLIPLFNDWEMFGKNSDNTRISDGAGPSEYSTYWYSFVGAGTDHRNGVVKQGVFYIPSSNGRTIYSFDADKKTGALQANDHDYKKTYTLPSNLVVNTSLAVTDELVIVVTDTPGTENKIIALNKNDLSNQKWIYSDPDHENIRFASPPVIHDNKIYVTSYSGSKKLIVLNSYGTRVWEKTLPGDCVSSPAVYSNKIIVGCNSENSNNLIAYDMNGNKLWEKTVGPVGKASPVIYNNKIFVTVKDPVPLTSLAYTKLYALNLADGNILWNFTLTSAKTFNLPNKDDIAASCTPAVYDDLIYVPSPDSKLYALNILDGSVSDLWENNPYNLYDSLIPPTTAQTSSAAYAGGIIYVGSPSGAMYAIDASDGSLVWKKSTYDDTPVLSSPIVVDGLVYYTDEDGSLYCVGKPKGTAGTQIQGTVISIPIKLPTPTSSYSWHRFYANYSQAGGKITFSILDKQGKTIKSGLYDDYDISAHAKNYDTIKLRADFTGNVTYQPKLYDWTVTFIKSSGVSTKTIFDSGSFKSTGTFPNISYSIDVKNEYFGLKNTSAEYNLQYQNKSNPMQELGWTSANITGPNGSKLTQTITADVKKQKFNTNITLLNIRFRITDISGNTTASEWYEIGQSYDNKPPIFYLDTFTPTDGWITSNTPTCTIKVRDYYSGQKITGLNVKSAKATITYEDNSVQKTNTFAANCTGTNGTTTQQTISIDISKLSIKDDIDELINIKFCIEDVAGNSNCSPVVPFSRDTEKPYSYISNLADIDDNINTTPVVLKAFAKDNISGIQSVTLYLRTSSTAQWVVYEVDSTSPYQWEFSRSSGPYELCTIAKDKAGNTQDYPTTAPVSFLFDPVKPSQPSYVTGRDYTFSEVPSFDDIEFEDDYKLDKVEYKLDIISGSSWVVIVDNINCKSYTPQWSLTDDDWDAMVEGEIYHIFFRLTDTLNNQYVSTSSDAMRIKKDLSTPIVEDYNPDLSDFSNWRLDNNYKVTVKIVDESKISNIKLYYSYSSDNKTWSNWTQYGHIDTNSPFSWDFTASEGSGFYRFKTLVKEASGLEVESDVKYSSVTNVSMFLLILMVMIAVILIIVTALVVVSRPARKAKKNQK